MSTQSKDDAGGFRKEDAGVMASNSVLVVEHYPDVLAFMETALARAGYDVLAADSAPSALDAVLHKPDLGMVISGDVLPNRSGLELLQAIKQSFPDIAVMLTTADTTKPPISSIPYLCKPFTARALIGRVREVLDSSQRATRAVRDALGQSVHIMTQPTAIQKGELRKLIKWSRQMRWQTRTQSMRHRPTILFVEDDPICRYAISHYLWKKGFDVLDASGCLEAAELWRDHRDRIDIVLMTVNGVDGLTLSNAFERDCPEKPIVLITADDAALPYPALHKPFVLDDLLARILRILEYQKSAPHGSAA